MKTRKRSRLVLAIAASFSVVNLFLFITQQTSGGEEPQQVDHTNTPWLSRDNNKQEALILSEKILEENSFKNYKYPSLKVPFYVYENGLNWVNATITGEPVHATEYPRFKHADDYWMLQAALEHPMRTRDPSKAKLFFVPTLMNMLFEMKHSATRNKMNVKVFMCVNGICGQEHLFRCIDQLLAESPWFQRHKGRDHIIVSAHADMDSSYTKPEVYYQYKGRLRIWQMSKITFEDRFTSSSNNEAQQESSSGGVVASGVDIPTLYVARSCPVLDTKTADFAMVASLHSDIRDAAKKARFQTRRDICNWFSQAAASSTHESYSVSRCGHGAQCPALGQARYGFHAKGDTPGSNRLQDTLLSGTVPIFTHLDQYKVLPTFIPWRALSEFVNVTSYETFVESLDAILRQPPEVYEAKRQLVLQWRDAVDVTTKVPFDLYMSEFATRLSSVHGTRNSSTSTSTMKTTPTPNTTLESNSNKV